MAEKDYGVELELAKGLHHLGNRILQNSQGGCIYLQQEMIAPPSTLLFVFPPSIQSFANNCLVNIIGFTSSQHF